VKAKYIVLDLILARLELGLSLSSFEKKLELVKPENVKLSETLITSMFFNSFVTA
jgi:hypothetical protein